MRVYEVASWGQGLIKAKIGRIDVNILHQFMLAKFMEAQGTWF